MKQWLANMKEFGYHFLDLLFTLEYEHMDKEHHSKRKSLDHETVTDSNTIH